MLPFFSNSIGGFWMFKYFSWLLVIPLALTLISCQEKGGDDATPVEVEPTETTYAPPSDGKISQTQADSYIKAALLLNETVLEQEKAIHEYAKVNELSDDLHELQDTVFIRENPKVKKQYEQLFLDSQKKLDEVYDKIGLSEDEFTWIGGALADTVNEGIRQQVEEALRPPVEEEGT
jgi:hypothetical protein